MEVENRGDIVASCSACPSRLSTICSRPPPLPRPSQTPRDRRPAEPTRFLRLAIRSAIGPPLEFSCRRAEPHRYQLRYSGLLHGHAVKHRSDAHGFLAVGDEDELGL